jgi:hypothetical protein
MAFYREERALLQQRRFGQSSPGFHEMSLFYIQGGFVLMEKPSPFPPSGTKGIKLRIMLIEGGFSL